MAGYSTRSRYARNPRYIPPRSRRRPTNLYSVGNQTQGPVPPRQTAGATNAESVGNQTQGTTVRSQGRNGGFTPFQAPDKPPAGTYDPTLDAALEASNRGLGDYLRDWTRDYGSPGGERGGRVTYDYLLQRGNNQETYKRGLSDLIRGYSNLATSQTGQANAAGLLGGGYAAQAAAKRATNEGREQGRMTTDYEKQQAALGLGYQRQYEDAASALERAQRENKFFGIDTRSAEFYQAAGTGYEPPSRPKGEHAKHGLVWREHGKGKVMLPDGRVISKDRLKEILRRRTHGAYGVPGTGYHHRGAAYGLGGTYHPGIVTA